MQHRLGSTKNAENGKVIRLFVLDLVVAKVLACGMVGLEEADEE